jgi:hypothetical protein
MGTNPNKLGFVTYRRIDRIPDGSPLWWKKDGAARGGRKRSADKGGRGIYSIVRWSFPHNERSGFSDVFFERDTDKLQNVFLILVCN